MGTKENHGPEVKHGDLKVGEAYLVVINEGLKQEYTRRVCVIDPPGEAVYAKNLDSGLSGPYPFKDCTFYRVEPEPVTPFIELDRSRTMDGKHFVFSVSEQRGEWEDYTHDGFTLSGPETRPEWNSKTNTLFPRGGADRHDDCVMTCTAKEWFGIYELVADFNKYHADLAKSVKVCLEEAAKPKTRKITADFDLGSETTATECRNCFFPGCVIMCCSRTYSGTHLLRHTECLAAEERYKAQEGAKT